MGLTDAMSGPGRAMGGVLDAIAAKLKAAGEQSDKFKKKQEDALKANIAAAAAKLQKKTDAEDKAARSEAYGTLGHYDVVRDGLAAQAAEATKADAAMRKLHQSELAANMAHWDTVALGRMRQEAEATAKAFDKMRAASRASNGGAASYANGINSMRGGTVGGQSLLGPAPNTSWITTVLQKLAQISPRAYAAAMGLGGLAVKADAALAKFGGLDGVLGKVGSGLLAVGGMALKAGLAIAGVAAAGAVALGKYIAEIQAFKQSTMFAFQALLGGASQAEGAWKKVQAVSLMTGTSLMDVGSAFNSLLAQGFKLDEVDLLVKRMADLKAINPATNIDGIARAIAQIKTAGTLQGDELNQLAEAGLNKQLVYEELAKSMGKTVAEVKKLQSAGKITSEQALDAVKKAMARAAGGRAPGELAAEAAGKTLSGAVGRMIAAVQIWAAGLNIDFSALGRFATRVGAVLNGDAGKRFGHAIEGAFQRVLGILDNISEEDISAGFDRAAEVVGAAGTAAEKFSNAVKTVDGWLDSVNSKTSAWGLAVQAVGLFFEPLIFPVRLLGSLLSDLFSGDWLVSGGIKDFFAEVSSEIDKLIAKLGAIFGVGPAGASSLTGPSLVGAASSSNTAGGAQGQGGGAAADQIAQLIAQLTGAGAKGPDGQTKAPVTKTYNITVNGYTDTQLTAKIRAAIDEADAAGADG